MSNSTDVFWISTTQWVTRPGACKESPTGRHKGDPTARDYGLHCIYCSQEIVKVNP